MPEVTRGVLLMSFGSARDEDDVPAYLARVRRGHPVSDALIADLRMRYRRTGGSPLLRITAEQASALEDLFQEEGQPVAVTSGMLHSEPTIAQGVEHLISRGAREIAALPMAPQESPHTQLYRQALAELGETAATITVAAQWHLDTAFIKLLASNLQTVVESLDPAQRDRAMVLFTAHSLPVRVPGADAYRDRITRTAEAVAARAGLAPGRWRAVFQSRSGAPDDWLGPDVLDVLPGIAAAGGKAVVAAPVQFLSDHLEVVYDLDIQVRERAEKLGLRYARPASANADPRFISLLASVAERAFTPAAL